MLSTSRNSLGLDPLLNQGPHSGHNSQSLEKCSLFLHLCQLLTLKLQMSVCLELKTEVTQDSVFQMTEAMHIIISDK